MTRVVNIKHESYDVYIGRSSKWGNPFRIGRNGSRAEVVAKYRAWIAACPDLLASLPELRGKRLGCFCKPIEGFKDQVLCHGQILAGLVDDVPPKSIE